MRPYSRPGTAVVSLLTALLLIISTVPHLRSFAQDPPGQPPQPVVGQAVAFAISAPARTLPPDVTVFKDEDAELNEKTIPLKIVRPLVNMEGATSDPVVQTFSPQPLSTPTPALQFEGISNADNFAAFGFRVSPPDTDGDVGPNHYVQIVNLLVRVFNKSGTPLTAPFKLSSLFTPLGGPCLGRDDGDPIALYDPLADRWLLSQFCTVATPFNHQMIAISQTGDPTGAYFLYDFMMPNNKFNDYPKFGVWPDAYYMTDNQFNQAGTAFLGAGAFAFDRAKMLLGDPTAGYIYFDIENGNPNVGGVLPSDLDGINPPPPGTPNYFAYFTADEFLDPAHPFDSLRVYEFRPNFANPGLSTFVERADSPILVAPFDPRSPAGRRDIEQPPPATSTNYLDAISDRLMFRLAYRNFGGHESLVVNHTVNVSGVAPTTPATHQAGIRYYELRRSLPSGSFFVNEQATFAPDAHNRWMGSVAQDNAGNLAVGYSVSSLTVFPSVRYAARLATDPPGGLFQGEAEMIAGSGVQLSTSNRWGDYSAMSVDPSDDCTFWYTQEYYTAASQATSTVGWLTRVGNFSLPGCTPVARGTVQGTVTNALTGFPVPGAVIQTSNGFTRVTNALGQYSMDMPPATFDMSASRPGFTSDMANGVVVSNGGTTTQNFVLTPIPIIMEAGAGVVVGEGCNPATGAIDPGEAVTVGLSVKNVGQADTLNLVGTLLAGGGVTNPGPPQTFGVVMAGGSSVSQNFTFTADNAIPCGNTLTATLMLQDGSMSLGMVNFNFVTGTLTLGTLTSTYSTGDIAVPIPDVSTIEIPISVPDTGSITDVNASVRLNHTFDGDLQITLIAPDGTQVRLASNRGGSGDNFGTGPNSCSGTFTVFDDSAANPISAGTAPFAGSFRPEQPLSALNGKDPAGTWKLRISDTAALDVGTVGCVRLEIARKLRVCCPFTSGSPIISAVQPANLTAESCFPANGAADPEETVTFNFPLRNDGPASTTDLVATLLSGGGVNAPSGPQSYGVLTPVSGAVSRSFSFVPSGVCGGQILATLALQDVGGAGSLGMVTFPIRIGGTTTGMSSFSNPGTITIPAGAPAVTSGAASPYPSNIAVSGITGTVSKVTVDLFNMNHTFPDDIDILLVGPGGQSLLLMSDAGGSPDLINVNLTFDDDAANSLPDSTLIASGTYRPTNFGTGDTFPAPAPAPPFGSMLSVFNGINPNGTWSLFVFDDAGADVGNIAGGWRLNITTADPVCCSSPCTLTCPSNITVNNTPNTCGAAVNFAPTVSGTCGVVSCAPPSGSTFPVGTTTVNCSCALTDGTPTGACSTNVTVNDVQGPTISGGTASPNLLWPPDHRMVLVNVAYMVTDNCSATCSLSVTSNEPINGLGDGDTAPDWIIVSPTQVRLRAERSGKGTGRIYTIRINCTDPSGNTSTRSVLVNVPHSQS